MVVKERTVVIPVNFAYDINCNRGSRNLVGQESQNTSQTASHLVLNKSACTL